MIQIHHASMLLPVRRWGYITLISLSAVFLNCADSRSLRAQETSVTALTETLPIPSLPSGTTLRIDSSALDEIIAHEKAVHGERWNTLKADGEVTSGGHTNAQSHATLMLSGYTRTRLEIKTTSGNDIIAIDGRTGRSRHHGESIESLSATAAEANLVQFQLLRGAGIEERFRALADQGLLVIEGRQLHRITGVLAGSSLQATSEARMIDFYFDPASHLLLKSSSCIRLSGSNNDLLLVNSYSDYRDAGETTLPYTISQTLDGQPQWQLQITQVELGSSMNSSSFSIR